jgi:hypothetical protein
VISKEDNKYLPKGYHLSGIAYMAGARSMDEKYILIGRDPSSACLGAGKMNSQTLQVTPVPHPFSTFVPTNSPLEGYTFHSRCWDLIELRVGQQAALHLDVVVSAVRNQWDIIIPQICNGETQYSGRHAFGLHHGLDDIVNSQDPLFIPELDTLLHEGARCGSEGQRKPSVQSLLTSKYKLPLEVKYMIAGCLSLEDTSHMLLAFGEEFPPRYWKQHALTDLLFELEHFNDKPFAWEYLAVEIEKRDIVNDYWTVGLRCRRRILDMLGPTRQRILEGIKGKEETSFLAGRSP